MKLFKTVAVQKKGSPVGGWPRLYSSNKRKEKWGTLRFTPLFTSLLYIYDSLSWSILHFLIRSGSVHATYGRSRTHEPLHLDPRNQNDNPEPPNNKLDNLDLTLNSKSQSATGVAPTSTAGWDATISLVQSDDKNTWSHTTTRAELPS